jgi:hypothetical protein
MSSPALAEAASAYAKPPLRRARVVALPQGRLPQIIFSVCIIGNAIIRFM